MQHQQTGNGYILWSGASFPLQSGVELKRTAVGRAPYFYFSFLSHSARRCLFTRRFLLTSAGKTLEPPPSLQIVLNQFPLLLLFRPNRTQACFLTGDSEVIKKNKTQHNTSKKNRNTPDSGSGEASSLTAPAALVSLLQSGNQTCRTYELVLIGSLILTDVTMITDKNMRISIVMDIHLRI